MRLKGLFLAATVLAAGVAATRCSSMVIVR